MSESIYKLKRKKTRYRFQKYTIRVFLIALTAVGILGLILPLRPKESDIEKRTLTEFPKPTVKTVLNGEFTDQYLVCRQLSVSREFRVNEFPVSATVWIEYRRNSRRYGCG